MEKEKKVEKAAGIDLTAAAPWRFSAAFFFSSAGLSWLLSLSRFFPFFLPLPTPIDRVSPNRGLKARHEADSLEPAEWSERLTSWQGGLARRCRRRIDPRCFLRFLTFLGRVLC